MRSGLNRTGRKADLCPIEVLILSILLKSLRMHRTSPCWRCSIASQWGNICYRRRSTILRKLRKRDDGKFRHRCDIKKVLSRIGAALIPVFCSWQIEVGFLFLRGEQALWSTSNEVRSARKGRASAVSASWAGLFPIIFIILSYMAWDFFQSTRILLCAKRRWEDCGHSCPLLLVLRIGQVDYKSWKLRGWIMHRYKL